MSIQISKVPLYHCGKDFVLHAKGPRIKPHRDHQHFFRKFASFWGFEGSNVDQNCHFSEAFSNDGTTVLFIISYGQLRKLVIIRKNNTFTT